MEKNHFPYLALSGKMPKKYSYDKHNLPAPVNFKGLMKLLPGIFFP
jgi:hypothetical protein